MSSIFNYWDWYEPPIFLAPKSLAVGGRLGLRADALIAWQDGADALSADLAGLVAWLRKRRPDLFEFIEEAKE